MREVVVRRAAAADILAARRWYDRHDPDLGAAFIAELDATLARLTEFPEAAPIVHARVRRALMHHFPYSVLYRDDATASLSLDVFIIAEVRHVGSQVADA